MTTDMSDPGAADVRDTYQPGVHDYRDAYYDPGYTPSDTEILAAFRVTPQPGVPPEEAAAAVAADHRRAPGPPCGPICSPTWTGSGPAATRSSRCRDSRIS